MAATKGRAGRGAAVRAAEGEQDPRRDFFTELRFYWPGITVVIGAVAAGLLAWVDLKHKSERLGEEIAAIREQLGPLQRVSALESQQNELKKELQRFQDATNKRFAGITEYPVMPGTGTAKGAPSRTRSDSSAAVVVDNGAVIVDDKSAPGMPRVSDANTLAFCTLRPSGKEVDCARARACFETSRKTPRNGPTELTYQCDEELPEATPSASVRAP